MIEEVGATKREDERAYVGMRKQILVTALCELCGSLAPPVKKLACVSSAGVEGKKQRARRLLRKTKDEDCGGQWK